MRDDRAASRREMQEFMKQQDAYQKERIQLLKEKNTLLKLLISRQNQEE